jgi:hypothetical protein
MHLLDRKTTYGDVCGLPCCCSICEAACSNFREDDDGALKEARCFLDEDLPTRLEKLSVACLVLLDLNIMGDLLLDGFVDDARGRERDG